VSACLICGSPEYARLFEASDRLYHTTAQRFAVVRCEGCGLIRLEPPPAPGELRQYYPGNYWFAPEGGAASRLEEAYRRLVLRDHVRFVEQALLGARGEGRGKAGCPPGPPNVGGALLDVGSGGGLFLAMMRERGFSGVGLDFSREAAAIAWRRQRAATVCADFERAPFRAGSVAAITMFHVLEHVYDPRAYLAAARSLLAPGGRLVVQVPNAASWQFRLLGESWNGVDVPRHLFDFRAADVEKLLTESGFEVLRRKFFSLRDNPAGLASSVAPWLDPMARRVRRTKESPGARLFKDLVYFALTVAALPPTALEAACGAGSTVMIEACRP
jgi:SAM-dependent methyltransferase